MVDYREGIPIAQEKTTRNMSCFTNPLFTYFKPFLNEIGNEIQRRVDESGAKVDKSELVCFPLSFSLILCFFVRDMSVCIYVCVFLIVFGLLCFSFPLG